MLCWHRTPHICIYEKQQLLKSEIQLAGIRSSKEYIKKQFEKELFHARSSYLIKNEDNLNIR